MYSHLELLKPKEWLSALHKVQVTQAKVTESTCVLAVNNVRIPSPGTTFFKYQIIRNAGLKEFYCICNWSFFKVICLKELQAISFSQ